MTMRKISAAIVFLMICSVCDAQIRCYECSTVVGLYKERCGDHFSLTSTESSSCRGYCSKIRGYRDKDLEVHRGCVQTAEEGCSKGDYFGMEADICYCNTELCNTGNTIVISRWTCLITAALSVLLAVFLHQ